MARKKHPGESSPSRARRKSSEEAETPESDHLLEAAEDNWPHILMAYRQFEDKKPVVLYDIQEKRIYVYPYADFSRELSERSQQSLKDEYEKAVQDNKIVVFVRGNEQQRLVSYSMNYE